MQENLVFVEVAQSTNAACRNVHVAIYSPPCCTLRVFFLSLRRMHIYTLEHISKLCSTLA